MQNYAFCLNGNACANFLRAQRGRDLLFVFGIVLGSMKFLISIGVKAVI